MMYYVSEFFERNGETFAYLFKMMNHNRLDMLSALAVWFFSFSKASHKTQTRKIAVTGECHLQFR